MYCRFLSKDQCSAISDEDVTLLARGGVNSVWRVEGNDSVVLKYSRLRPDSAESDFVATKMLAWDAIARSNIMGERRQKALLDNLVMVPYHRELVYDDDGRGGAALMTIERFVRGVELEAALMGDAAEVPGAEIADALPALAYIIGDIIAHLEQAIGFNHNDLHMGNIMLVPAFKCFPTKYQSLTEPNVSFPTPSVMPIVLDFDWATISPVPPSQQHVYDRLQSRLDETARRFPHSVFGTAHSRLRTRVGTSSTRVDAVTFLLDMHRLALLVPDPSVKSACPRSCTRRLGSSRLACPPRAL